MKFIWVGLLSAGLAAGQVDRNAHGWYQYFGDHPIGNSRWGLHLEGQWRRHDVLLRGQNLLLRPAINFKINKTFELSGGYAFVETYRYGSYPVARTLQENRIYQELRVRHDWGKVKVLHRFRSENRWLPGDFFEDRFRYLLRGMIPLKGKNWLILANEVFIPTPPESFPKPLDNNRAMVLWGRTLNPYWRLETGYMLQTVTQRNGRVREDNHTLLFSLWSTQPLR
jgi:hypothetical protein